jgi:catechol 2,3-dioxygenase-like lactoylglutathione lyase family enzyme
MKPKAILIQIFVSDISKAERWYKEKLDFSLIERFPKWKCVYMKFGNALFDIGEPIPNWGRNWKRAKSKIGDLTGIFFEVDDIQETYKKLKKKGVRFITKPKLKSWNEFKADFVDFDGNEFSIIQEKK